MASKSEVTFGSKLANAQKIATQLSTSTTYQPPASELKPAALQDMIAALNAANANVATYTAGYSAAVDQRQKAFRKGPDSIIRLLSPIAAGVRSVYGKSGKEAADITSMIKNIRGIKVKKAAAGANEKAISQSEASYGSVAKAFADIVTTLGTYSRYNPANGRIAFKELRTKVEELTRLSNGVTTAYSQLKPARDERAAGYKALRAAIQRTKDAVKSQYGNSSSEYAQLKGLKV